MNPEFWKGKRVLVTGHTGFKGSWLSLWLQALGAEVTGYALEPPTNPSLFEVANVGRGMHSVTGDIIDLPLLIKTLEACKADIVFHLAAQSVVRTSYEEPLRTFSTNLLGSVTMMEAVRQVKGVKAVVLITSDKCYHNREWNWGYREADALGGHDPYSSSKACIELAAAAYRSSYFSSSSLTPHSAALATTRAGNVIGGGDWKRDALVPDIIRSLMNEERAVLRHPQATRPWQFVLDPLNGYLVLAERLYAGEFEFADSWNFGPHDVSVKDVGWIATRLYKLWGSSKNWEKEVTQQPYEDRLLKLDTSKAAAQLNWHTLLDVETALSWIVDWTKAYQASENMHDKTASQIQSYMKLMDNSPGRIN